MKYSRWYLALILCLSSLHSNALLIVDSIKNVPLEVGYTGFSTNMFDLGYNPATDVSHSIRLLLSFREIVDNGDDWDLGTMESVIFHAMPWGYRELVYSDISTETISFGLDWELGEDHCTVWLPDGECGYDPSRSGRFSISMTNYSSNLIMDEVRWEFDVTRTLVSESSTAILLMLGLACLVISRRKKPLYSMNNTIENLYEFGQVEKTHRKES